MENELTHYGIPGMKWGQRRYQNKDGSLTSAGRKRYGDDWNGSKKSSKSEKPSKPEKSKKKSASEMTDAELNAAINRARMEDTYRQLRPEPVPKGKAFIKSLMGNVVAPAAMAAGKKQLENLLNKYGDEALKKAFPEVVDKNSKKYLEETRDKLKLKKEIKDLEEDKKKELTWDEKLKKQQYEQNEIDNARKNSEYEFNANVDAAKRAKDTAEAMYKAAENYYKYEDLRKSRATTSSGQDYTSDNITTDYRDITNSSNVSAGQNYTNALIRLYDD